MADNRTLTYTVKAVADISDVQSNVQNLKKILGQLKLPDTMAAGFEKSFAQIEKDVEKVQVQMAKGFKTKGDVSNFERAMASIVTQIQNIGTKIKGIDTKKLKGVTNFDIKGLEAINTEIDTLRKKINQIEKNPVSIKTDVSKSFAELNQIMNRLSPSAQKLQEILNKKTHTEEDYKAIEKALQGVKTGFQRVTEEYERAGGDALAPDDSIRIKFEAYKKALDDAKLAVADFLDQGAGLQNLKQTLDEKTVERFQLLADLVQGEVTPGMEQLANETSKFGEQEQKAAQSSQDLNSNLESLKSKITMFFGLTNAAQLLRRTIQETYKTIKELDDQMTEMAVVTDLGINDYWKQLPEYTKRANKLGLSIKGVYEADTLFYQQGLKTNEVVALSNETLKMARIASLDSEDATNRMTAALRGFNMELDEASAKNVNDVYSKLAAITASDVDEISTAMDKTASIANSANMTFENTAAFLSQIIETTREAPETAGTALKTIIARFSEVKTLYDQGIFEGTDEEGEAIAVNKIATALQTAGINMNAFFAGTEGLDSIFMKLAEKWDSLTTIQQRYIATQAAGSRQQSRFIALMSDYDRTVELTNAANNAAGASEEQFGKTLDSVTTAATRLKNAWNEFILGLTDNQFIVQTINLFTTLLNTVNKFFDLFGQGGLRSAVQIGALVAGFFGLKRAFELGAPKVTKYFATIIDGTSKAEEKVKWFSKQKWFGDQKDLEQQAKNIWGANVAYKANLLTLEEYQSEMKELGITEQEYGFITSKNLDEKTASLVLTQKDTIAKMYNKKSIEELTDEEIKEGAAKLQSDTIRRNGILGMFNESAARILGIAGIKAETVAEGEETTVKGLSLLVTKLKTLADKKETAGIWAKIIAQNAELIVLLLIVAAIAAVIGAIVLVAKAIKTEKERQEEANEQLKNAQEEANKAKEAYDSLYEAVSNYKDAKSSLEQLTEGTSAWREQLIETNAQARELLSLYPELLSMEDAVDYQNGELILNQDKLDELIKQYQKANLLAEGAAAQSQIFKNRADYDVAINQLDTSKINQVGWDDTTNSEVSYATGNLNNIKKWDYSIEDINEKRNEIANATSENLADYADKMGIFLKVTTDNLEDSKAYLNKALDTYEAKLIANNNAYQASLSAILGTGDYSQDRVKLLSQNLSGSESMTKLLEKYNKEYSEKNFKAGGGGVRKNLKDLAAMFNVDTAGLNEVEAMQATLKGMGLNEYKFEDGTKESKKDNILNEKLQEAAPQAIMKQIIDTYNEELNVNEDFKKLAQKDLEIDAEAISTSLDEAIYGPIIEEMKKSQEQAVTDFTDKVTNIFGAEGAKEILEDRSQWNEINETLTTFDKISMGSEKLNGVVDGFIKVKAASSEGYETLEDMAEEISGLDFSNPISGARSLKEMIESTETNVKELGETISSMDDYQFSQTNQANYLWNNFTNDQKKGLLDDDGETISAKKVKELSKAHKQLREYLDQEGSSTAALTDYFQMLNDGLIDVTSASKNFVKALKEMGGVDSIFSDALESLDNFEISKTAADIDASFGDIKEKFDELKYQGLISSDGIIDIETLLWGEEGFAQKLKEANGNMATLATEANTLISNFNGSFYNLWVQAAGGSSLYDAVDGVIRFNLDNITSMEQLVSDVMEQLGVSEQMANYMISEASQNSSDLRTRLNDIGKDAGINTWLEGALTKMGDGEYLISESEAKAIAAKYKISYEKELKPKLEQMAEENQITLSFGDFIEIDTKGTKTFTQKAVDKMAGELKELSGDELSNQVASIIQDAAAAGLEKAEIEEKVKKALVQNGKSEEEITTIWQDSYEKSGLADKLFNDTRNASTQFAVGMYYAMAYLKEDMNTITDETVNKINEGAKTMYDKIVEAGSILKTDMEEGANNAGYALTGKYKSDATTNAPSTSNAYDGGPGAPTGDKSAADKEKPWENPYDQYYNLLEEITEEERKRNKLEREYNRMLEDSNTSLKDLNTNYQKQLESIETERKKDLEYAAGKKAQIENLPNWSYYNEEEGQYESYGGGKLDDVTKYGKYNFDTGTLEIDYEALSQISDEAVGKKAEDYISKLEEFAGDYEEYQDAADEKIDEYNERQQEQIDEWLAREEEVMEALQNIYQGVIDTQQAMFDAVSESENKVLDNLREQVELERQIRDNTETEKNIADKEAQLAYLSRDTTGASDLEILNMQKELDDARQDYTDSLIDQALDQMQTDNEKAQEQRTQMIDRMNLQLQWMNENGVLWKQVHDIMADERKLMNLMKTSDGFDKLSEDSKTKWADEFLTKFNDGFVGQSAAKVKEAEETGSITIGNVAYKLVDDGKGGKHWLNEATGDYYDRSALTYDTFTGKYSMGTRAGNTKDDANTASPPGEGGDPNLYKEDDESNNDPPITPANDIKLIRGNARQSAINDAQQQTDKYNRTRESYVPIEHKAGYTEIGSYKGIKYYSKEGASGVIYYEDSNKQIQSIMHVTPGSSRAKEVGTNATFIYNDKEYEYTDLTDNGARDEEYFLNKAGKWVSTNANRTRELEYLTKPKEFLSGAINNGLRGYYYMYHIGDKNVIFSKNGKRYETGGLADYTGPAWLDGTKSRPELVLNQQDTQNFIQLRDILRGMESPTSNSIGDVNAQVQINVGQLSDDYDVDQLASRVQQKIYEAGSYRNNNIISGRR